MQGGAQATLNGNRVLVLREAGRWFAMVGIPLATSPGSKLPLEVRYPDNRAKTIEIAVTRKKYAEQRLTVAKEQADLDPEQLKQYEKERVVIVEFDNVHKALAAHDSPDYQTALKALGNGAEARQSYERAAALAPAAQSPLFGLSRVADQAGDRAAAREAIARVLKLPRDDFELADPWWVYEVAQSREIDRLLDDVRARF